MSRHDCAVAVFALLITSCTGASSAPTKTSPPTAEQWAQARAALAALRSVWAPRTETTRIAIHFALGNIDVEGRGAVAVRLPDALRMQIVGPGGLTAMDLWVSADRWRFALPQRERVVRGGASAERDERGLPVGFLRWWLLHPLEGRLLSAHKGSAGWTWILKDGEAVVEVREDGPDGVAMERRSGAGRERVWARTPGCATVRYEHRDTRVSVDVRCEGVSTGTPGDAAFEDPDARAGEAISDP